MVQPCSSITKAGNVRGTPTSEQCLRHGAYHATQNRKLEGDCRLWVSVRWHRKVYRDGTTTYCDKDVFKLRRADLVATMAWLQMQ